MTESVLPLNTPPAETDQLPEVILPVEISVPDALYVARLMNHEPEVAINGYADSAPQKTMKPPSASAATRTLEFVVTPLGKVVMLKFPPMG